MIHDLTAARIVRTFPMSPAGAAAAALEQCEPVNYLLRVRSVRRTVVARRRIDDGRFVLFSKIVYSRRPKQPTAQRDLFT